MTSIAVTAQQVEQSQQAVDIAQANFDDATASLEIAKLNLERSTVVAPVNGFVTNFGLLPGRYITAGASVLALIDSDTFRVEGYFEETKLRRIHIGDSATVELIGDPAEISGHVESIALGHRRSEPQHQQRPVGSVNPTFNWVRLAQRVPVRIKLDNVPPQIRLATGRTATVAVGKIDWW